MKALRLTPGGLRKILSGRLWLKMDDLAESPHWPPGTWLILLSPRGEPVATGYLDFQRSIALRVVATEVVSPEVDFFRERFKAALCLRRELFPGEPAYRLVFSEADFLPGLIVDRYGDLFVLQVATVGMATCLKSVLAALEELFPQGAFFLQPGPGLDIPRGFVRGTFPLPYWVKVGGLLFPVDPESGQKTGLFLDQRENQKAARRFFSGRRILDLFCYLGGWALNAAASGAREVLGVDRSAWAISQARLAARRNGLEVQFLQEDVFSFLRRPQRPFDVVIVDPPALIKKRSHLAAGLRNYRRLNHLAIKALKPGGLLISCSCSHHLSLQEHQHLVQQAAQGLLRPARLLEIRGQSPDHPVLLSMPETAYLKCLLIRV